MGAVNKVKVAREAVEEAAMEADGDYERAVLKAVEALVDHAEGLERRVAELEARPGPDPRSAFIGG